MQQDKKIAELEEKKAWQQELEFAKEDELENELEIETIDFEIESDEVLEKKKRKEVIFEMALFLILGILIGITVKTEALKRITIGFNDYQIKKSTQSYDLTALKKQLDDQAALQQQAADQQDAGSVDPTQIQQ